MFLIGVTGIAMRDIPMPNTTSNEGQGSRGVHDIVSSYTKTMEHISQPATQVTVQVGQRSRFLVPAVNRQGRNDRPRQVYNALGNPSTRNESRSNCGEQEDMGQSQTVRLSNSSQNRFHTDFPINQLTPPRQSGSVLDFPLRCEGTEFRDDNLHRMEDVRHPKFYTCSSIK